MKAFAIYTGLRLVLFAACFAVLWVALNNWLTIFPLLLIALIISSILSIFVLRAARDRLAGTIEQRASRISSRIEASRRAEDDD
jgi:ABC-type bacteriocin/lantibiotic exporter with double-glycine peptidase domain